MNKKELVKWIEHLIELNQLDRFYHSRYFRAVKKEVLKEQHFECQRCKESGKLTIVKEDRKRSGLVHHHLTVREHPSKALDKYYIDEHGIKQKQLIVLCNPCHEIIHDRFSIERKEPLNEERW